MQSDTQTPPTQGRLKSILGGSIGNLVEWYDWYAYSAFALYFSKVFFPNDSPTAQLLNTAAIFFVGFIVRPLGGWWLGWYCDKYGRKAGLTASILLMCFGSLIIALTPGYAQIGVAAPALLIFARLLQGLSVGGEYGASATYLSEMAGEKHRGFYSSFQYVTLIAGQLLALGLLIVLQTWLLSSEALHEWGWRIAFWIGALLSLVTLYIRRHIHETASFEKRAEIVGNRTWILISQHPLEALQVIGLTLGGTVAFYTYSIYMQKFLVNTSGWSKPDATALSALTLGLFALLQPVFGALSDRVGRKPLLIAFGVLGMIFTVPIMTSLATVHDFWTGFALIMSALVIVSGYTSINAVVKAELFPSHVRALGVALPYAIAVSLFGGSAEYVALWLKQAGVESYFFWYVSGCIGVSLLVYLFTADSKHRSRFKDEDPATLAKAADEYF